MTIDQPNAASELQGYTHNRAEAYPQPHPEISRRSSNPQSPSLTFEEHEGEALGEEEVNADTPATFGFAEPGDDSLSSLSTVSSTTPSTLSASSSGSRSNIVDLQHSSSEYSIDTEAAAGGSTSESRSSTPVPRIRTRTRSEFENEDDQEHHIRATGSSSPSGLLTALRDSRGIHAHKRPRLDNNVSVSSDHTRHIVHPSTPVTSIGSSTYPLPTPGSSQQSSGPALTPSSSRAMRLPDNADDSSSILSVSYDSNAPVHDGPLITAGTGALGSDLFSPISSNGHSRITNGNGTVIDCGSTTALNGSSSRSKLSGDYDNGRSSKNAIARVDLPGTRLFEDSYIDREEFIRLIVQSLRDVGYK